MRASFCKFSYFYWLQQILIYLFLLLFGKTNNVVVAFFYSASTDADVCIDRRGCSYRPTRMIFVDVLQCQTFTFVLPNRCFCGSKSPFPYLTPSFSCNIFLCFPRLVVFSCCVYPLVAALKTVSRAYNSIMCASTKWCFNCKQLLRRA